MKTFYALYLRTALSEHYYVNTVHDRFKEVAKQLRQMFQSTSMIDSSGTVVAEDSDDAIAKIKRADWQFIVHQ